MESKLTIQDRGVLPATQAAAMSAKVETYRRIGVSRPDLAVSDLPTPEEVYQLKRVGWEELILFILGPSLVALGVSMGSGEWMHGPYLVGQYGLKGMGVIILISVVLQVFYNVELARFTLATGEAPIVAFGRVPPGWLLWIPLALVCFYLAFILGDWAVYAGQGLFALFTGRPNTVQEAELVRILSILLMAAAFFIVILGRKVVRTMEMAQGSILAFILIGLVMVTMVVIPTDFLKTALVSMFTPAAPPHGSDPGYLGSLAGYAALAAGLNFMFIGYYRDKGYGMGAKTGFISGIVGGQKVSLAPVGTTFRENETNSRIWKRWFRYLLLDQWGVYFGGAMLGMLLPTILVAYLYSLPFAAKPTTGSILTYAAVYLGQRFGPVVFGWAIIIGFAILFTSQIAILELLARNFTDAVFGISARARSICKNDPRWLYYPWMILLVIAISMLIHMTLPGDLIVLSGNLANLAALLFPLAMIYLNLQLPRPARIRWWSVVVLLANSLFFGFFFLNFLSTVFLKAPLVRF